MGDDIKDILTLSNHISDVNKKKKPKKEQEIKKKPGMSARFSINLTLTIEISNKEVLSLTGGLFPM